MQNRFSLDIPVDEYTTPNPVTAEPDLGMDDLIALMKENGIRHLPIVHEGEVIGVISDRDLKLVKNLDLEEKTLLKASDIMAENPVTVRCDTPLEEVALRMSREKIGSVIVNDENECFYGIFTSTDALNALIEVIRGWNVREH